MKRNIISKSRALMERQTKKNGAPVWRLTEIAVSMGKKLAHKYHANEKLVVTSLYLAHIVFHTERKSSRMKNHPKFSSNLARVNLKKWGVSKTEQDIIVDAIATHHSKLRPKSTVAEVMRNAEGYKFLTMEGCLVFLHALGARGMSFKESVKYLNEKMNDKYLLLTFPQCQHEAKKNMAKLSRMLEKIV